MIIDACCLSRVFNTKNADHERFRAVYEWLTDGNGRMVFGGTTYQRELEAASKVLSRIVELIKGKKLRIQRISDTQVDEHEERIKSLCRDKAFNDPHLVAIVCASRCPLVCTDEHEAVPFLKNKKLYCDGAKVPKIYSGKKCAKILGRKEIRGYYRK